MNQKRANIKTNIDNFFTMWMRFTEPFHKLAPRYQMVIAILLRYHYDLGKEITNEKVLWKEVFSYESKIKLADEMNINKQSVENLLTYLRKRNVIINNRISPAYLPDLSNNPDKFSININFHINYAD